MISRERGGLFLLTPADVLSFPASFVTEGLLASQHDPTYDPA